MEIITSKTNNKIKNIINLINDKKERINQGLFVLEGLKILNEAVNSDKINILMLFMTQKFWENNKIKLKFVLNKNINMAIITEEVCNKISSHVTPQGIFAICEIPPKVLLKTVLDNGKNILMVLSVQDTGNFGNIIRTASALGIDYIITSKDCPDIYNFKVLRSAMGTAFNMGVTTISEPIESLKRFKSHGFKLYASVLMDGCENVKDISFADKNLIVVGNEGNGLDQKIIKECDKIINIPMSNGVNSLNVSVATGILLWELRSKCYL